MDASDMTGPKPPFARCHRCNAAFHEPAFRDAARQNQVREGSTERTFRPFERRRDAGQKRLEMIYADSGVVVLAGRS